MARHTKQREIALMVCLFIIAMEIAEGDNMVNLVRFHKTDETFTAMPFDAFPPRYFPVGAAPLRAGIIDDV